MNLLALETYVANALQCDPTFPSGSQNWSKSEVDQYLDDEQMKLFVHVVGKDEDFLYTTATPISEVAGTALYSLPTNLFRVLRVERIAGMTASTTNPIPMCPVEKNVSQLTLARGWGWPYLAQTGAGVAWPMNYQIHGQSQLELIPPPTTNTSSAIQVVYAFRPATMAAPTDVPFQLAAGSGGAGKDNLTEFHDLIALGAIEKCFLKTENYAQADRFKQLRLERLAELTNYLRQINVQQSRSIRVTDAVWGGD